MDRCRKINCDWISTLMEIFGSEEVVKYVEDSIITAWNNAPAEQEMEYLQSFYQVDSEKALYIIKKHIERENVVDFDLRSFDNDSKKNYHNISTKERCSRFVDAVFYKKTRFDNGFLFCCR